MLWQKPAGKGEREKQLFLLFYGIIFETGTDTDRLSVALKGCFKNDM